MTDRKICIVCLKPAVYAVKRGYDSLKVFACATHLGQVTVDMTSRPIVTSANPLRRERDTEGDNRHTELDHYTGD
jgi:hypothetical protein